MTDYWSRPSGGDEPVFEITVYAGDGTPGGGPLPDETPSSNRLVGIIAAVVAIAIAAGVVVAMATGDESAQPAATTSPLETLPPIDTSSPSPDDELSAPEVRPSADPDESQDDEPPMAALALELPVFPVVPGTTPERLAVYDLAAAVAANVPGDVPRRSMFTVVGSEPDGTTVAELGTGVQRTLRASAANEPGTARDLLTVEVGDTVSRLVVDRQNDVVYARSRVDETQWRTLDAESLTRGTGADELGALFDAFVTGPITPDSLAASEVTAHDELVRLPGGVFARRFDVETPITALQPFGALLFAGVSTGTVATASAPDAITFQVYVTDQPELAMVMARFDVEPQTYVLSQFFDKRPANVRVELPATAS